MVTTKKRNRKDHVLPQSYLRAFINPGRHGLQEPLWYYNVPTGKWALKSPAGIAWHRGFYDYSIGAEAQLGLATADADFVLLEDKYTLVIRDLSQNSYQNWRDYLEYLLQFAQMLRVRSSLFMSQQMEQVKASIVGVVEEVLDNKAIRVRNPNPEDVSPEKLRDHALSQMRQEISKGSDWMNEFHWSLAVSPGVLDPFVTSAHPVSIVGPGLSLEQNFTHPLTFLQIPVSWRACLFGGRTDFPDRRGITKLTSNQMASWRRDYIRHAREFVVSPTNLIRC